MSSTFANRLIAARKIAGLSLQTLADKLGGIISKQALSKYEQGKTYPNSKILIELSRALSVPVDFFFTESETQVVLSGIEFRKKVALPKTAETALIEKCTEELNRYITLEKAINVELPPTKFEFGKIIRDAIDVEDAADKLRTSWNLGNDPIPSVIAMLENNGYKVILIDAPESFDGLKAQFEEHRLIVVNKNFDTCRIRFTALHELAHHVLTFSDELSEKEMEKLCHTFAGAVLFPQIQVHQNISEGRKHFFDKEFIALKEYWGISLSAIMARLKTLALVSEQTYVSFHKECNLRGFRKNEPGHFGGVEEPRRFQRLLYRGLAEEIISYRDGAMLANVSIGELRDSLQKLA